MEVHGREKLALFGSSTLVQVEFDKGIAYWHEENRLIVTISHHGMIRKIVEGDKIGSA